MHPVDETAQLVMEGGVHGLRERPALATHILELGYCCHEYGYRAADSAFRRPAFTGYRLHLSGKRQSRWRASFNEPPQWTWGIVQEGLTESSNYIRLSFSIYLGAIPRPVSAHC